MTDKRAAYLRPSDIDDRSTALQRFQWRLESVAWDLFYWWPMKALGPDRASNTAGAIVRWIGPRLSQHKTVLKNLRLAFPEWSDQQVHATALKAWESVGRTAGELPHLPAIDPYQGGRVDVINAERLDTIEAAETGAVMISGHFANWEVMAAVICRRPVDCLVTYRALNNPHIDRKVDAVRRAYGIGVLAPKGLGTRELMRALSQGRVVALMNDQKFNQGIPSPFFGHDAMTAPGPSRLALKYGVPIVPVSTVRTGPARFRVTIHDPITPTKTGDTEADVARLVAQISAFIEDQVRAEPGQWFWQHRRWPKDAWKAAGVN